MSSCDFSSSPFTFSKTRFKRQSSIFKESQCAQYNFYVVDNGASSGQIGRWSTSFHLKITLRSGLSLWSIDKFFGSLWSLRTVVRKSATNFCLGRLQCLQSAGQGLLESESAFDDLLHDKVVVPKSLHTSWYPALWTFKLKKPLQSCVLCLQQEFSTEQIFTKVFYTLNYCQKFSPGYAIVSFRLR